MIHDASRMLSFLLACAVYSIVGLAILAVVLDLAHLAWRFVTRR